MKLKTTNKQIRANFYKVLSVGYCDAQYLLQYKKPFAYTCGTYGWCADFYEFDNVCISTGYRPIGEKIDYELIREYEAKAKKIRYNQTIDYNQRKAQVTELLNEFVKKATK